MVISRATMINLMRAAEVGSDLLVNVPDFRRSYLSGLASNLALTYSRSHCEFVKLSLDED